MRTQVRALLILVAVILFAAMAPGLLPTGNNIGNRGYIYPPSFGAGYDEDSIPFCSDPMYYTTQIGAVRAGSRCVVIGDGKFVCGFPPVSGYPCHGYTLYERRIR